MTCVILEQGAGKPPLVFENPRRVIRAGRPDEVEPALAQLEAALASGFHAAGFFSYELSYALEPKLAALMPERRGFPLLWFGVFEGQACPPNLEERRRRGDKEEGSSEKPGCLGFPYVFPSPNPSRREGNLSVEWDEAAYRKRFDRVKAHIEAGDVYQVNLTFRARFSCADPRGLYGRLRAAQPTSCGAYIETPDFQVISCSPELFFSLQDGYLVTRPMKGTAPRHDDATLDRKERTGLAQSEKSRAENLMIVDLMRNDLGRVAETGSVKVPKLFEVETHPTLHQMTSTVEARLKRNTGAAELVRALFPPGSVTGAPKIRTQEIIAELESSPRGVYTGAIGHFGPDGSARFNVAIRTVAVDTAGQAEIGIGGGVVHDSEAKAEYAEALLKMRFLQQCYSRGSGDLRPADPPENIRLIETMRWEKGKGIWLEERHRARLTASATHFGFICDGDKIFAALEDHAKAQGAPVLRVRLLLNRAGDFEITSVSLPETPVNAPDKVLRFRLAGQPVDAASWQLAHKTTAREFYDDARKGAQAEGCDEILFFNSKGELTEGSFTNLFVRIPGEEKLLTPPLSCGLLPGCLRAALLDSGQAREAVLRSADLDKAETVYLGNSVRGLVEAVPDLADVNMHFRRPGAAG